jgi:hypothetical protein
VDAFTVGEISEENIDRMCDAMKAFNLQQALFRRTTARSI